MQKLPYQLSEHARRRVETRGIRPEWLVMALENPDRIDLDRQDSALHHALKKIPDMEDRVCGLSIMTQ